MNEQRFLFLAQRGYAMYDKNSGTACMMEFSEMAYDYQLSRLYYTNGLLHQKGGKHCFPTFPPKIAIAGFWASNANGEPQFFTCDGIVSNNEKRYTINEIVFNLGKPLFLCLADGGITTFRANDLIFVGHNKQKNHAYLLESWFGMWKFQNIIYDNLASKG